ncbi:MAG TPA: histidine kinase dimerization/phospho-acceptor domain-containing protein [Sphingomicrobium sp.]
MLNQPASDRHDAAVRWRQLVDLVARAGPNSSSPTVVKALESIREEAGNVEESLRAAAARAVAALPLPLGLLECFANDRLTVSAPVLAAASLEPAQWRALLAGADEETRRFVETLHPEISESRIEDSSEALVERAPEPPPAPAPAVAPAGAGPSLSDVVARIERRRRSREQQRAGGPPGPGLAADGGAPTLFRWECGPSGEIAWIEGAPRGALIGRTLARVEDESGARVDEEAVRAFAMRAPFRDASFRLPGEGLVSGEWKISGVPAFEPADGRFAGYRGIALRDVPAPSPEAEASEVFADPDSLRELVHEIKTPLTAIIGFAEIIDGQYLGPADRRYRERAGEIVGQARLLLGAIDDLDFAAKIHSAAPGDARRADLGDQLDALAPTLRELASARGVELEVARPPRMPLCAVEPELADRLLYRLSSAVIEQAGAGERLRLALEEAKGACRFSIGRPAALRGIGDAQLFDTRSPEGESHALGVGFSLRLVRGLARIAGGDLDTSPAGIALLLPTA